MSERVTSQRVRRQIGRAGVWLGALALEPAVSERAIVAEIEQLGYGAVWVGEGPANREALSHAGMLLQACERMTVATGIANVWARDAAAAINGANTLCEAYSGRFVLGLGVSHKPIVDSRGHTYDRPLAAMREYLEAIEQQRYAAPAAEHPSPIVLAALGPKMLELARDHSAGAHPYFVPPEHTELARGLLGPEPLLAPEQAVVLESDPSRARELARGHMALYLRLPNYVNNLLRLGYEQSDVSGGGSDALVDAIVAWGDEQRIAQRVREHLDAGADHVCVQPIADGPDAAMESLRALAPALLEL